jgi:putative tryptophan/tyrosine transport system substrate-binding protein
LLIGATPSVTRVAVLRTPSVFGVANFAAIQAAAPSVRVEVSRSMAPKAGAIERVIPALAQGSNGGLIYPGGGLPYDTRERIIALAVRHRVPAVYGDPDLQAGRADFPTAPARMTDAA